MACPACTKASWVNGIELGPIGSREELGYHSGLCRADEATSLICRFTMKVTLQVHSMRHLRQRSHSSTNTLSRTEKHVRRQSASCLLTGNTAVLFDAHSWIRLASVELSRDSTQRFYVTISTIALWHIGCSSVSIPCATHQGIWKNAHQHIPREDRSLGLGYDAEDSMRTNRILDVRSIQSELDEPANLKRS